VRGAENVQNHPYPFLLPAREKAILRKKQVILFRGDVKAIVPPKKSTADNGRWTPMTAKNFSVVRALEGES
jgi:hypothetical protein